MVRVVQGLCGIGCLRFGLLSSCAARCRNAANGLRDLNGLLFMMLCFSAYTVMHFGLCRYISLIIFSSPPVSWLSCPGVMMKGGIR